MTTKEQEQESTERGYCAMSPTGAHRWILEGPSQTMRGECKYCHAERTFSPFEALRSDETLDVFRRYLTEVKVRTAGAIVGLIMFVRPPAPLGRPRSMKEALLRRVVSFKAWLLREGGSRLEINTKLAKQLLPLDRRVSEAGTLTPTNGFAVYRKRVHT